MRNLQLENNIEDFEEIDIEKALSSSIRRYYPKIARKCKLDDFLTRRTYLKFMEEKKFTNIMANTVKSEEVDVKTEEDKIDVENEDPDHYMGEVCDASGDSSEQKLKNIASVSKNIDSLRDQYLELIQLFKHSKCYSNSCNKVDMSTLLQTPDEIKVNCFSPLCIKKEKIIHELLNLLKAGNNHTLVSSTTKNEQMTILEQYLLGKKSSANSNENILNDLLSAVVCAEECDNRNSDSFVKRKSIDACDASVKSEASSTCSIKSEKTLDECAVPAVGNEMDIDITCNNNEENDVEVGPLKELTDPDEELHKDDAAQDDTSRPPIPKLRITRGRSAKLAANVNVKGIDYKCSLTPNSKPKYRATVNRRFGLPRTVKREEKAIKEEKTENGLVRVYSTEKPSGKVYLKKVQTSAVEKRKKRIPVKYPLCSTFHTKSKAKTIMVLSNHELRKLCRSGGHSAVCGFSHNAKPNQALWPYPCARPLLKTCWLYRTVNLTWLTSAALQLRIMWACLRWDDMVAKPATADGKHQLTTDTEIVSLELLKHRNIGQFSERTQYLRRRVVIPLELPKTIREVTSIRSGLRKRKRAESPQNTEPQVSNARITFNNIIMYLYEFLLIRVFVLL